MRRNFEKTFINNRRLMTRAEPIKNDFFIGRELIGHRSFDSRSVTFHLQLFPIINLTEAKGERETETTRSERAPEAHGNVGEKESE